MDFGELLFVLAIIPEKRVYNWLDRNFGNDYQLGITQIFGFQSTEETAKSVANKRSKGITPHFHEVAVSTSPFVEATCAMSGRIGLCRQIQLIA